MSALPIVLPFGGYAETEMVNGITWTYTVSNGKASLVQRAVPQSTTGAITIPTTLGGNPVTSIESYAFSGCSGLTSVAIPDSVTSIESYAFSGCSGLRSITLPCVGSKRGNTGKVDSVFGYIFGSSSYTGGKKITQCYDGPENSPSIVYYIPSALKSVTITDESVLGYGAFYGCAGLTNVVMNSGVISVGGYSFRNCTGISELVIADSVETIGVGAFRGSGIKKK